ncbi:MAG: 50S ribosomal protein L18 [archaeon]
MRTQKRRRKENRTDYLKRLKLLKSEKPRVVFRRTNKYIIAQYVESVEAKDKVKMGISSKNLLKHGWPKESSGSLKSITASYLTGYLMGKKISKLEKPIVDFGMIQSLHKTKVFAFLKGLKDAGVEIECRTDAFPSEDRIKGEHLKNKVDVEKIKEKIK